MRVPPATWTALLTERLAGFDLIGLVERVGEEWMNLKLHDLCEEEQRLIGRHDVIDVSHIGVLQFGLTEIGLFKKVLAANIVSPCESLFVPRR